MVKVDGPLEVRDRISACVSTDTVRTRLAPASRYASLDTRRPQQDCTRGVAHVRGETGRRAMCARLSRTAGNRNNERMADVERCTDAASSPARPLRGTPAHWQSP